MSGHYVGAFTAQVKATFMVVPNEWMGD